MGKRYHCDYCDKTMVSSPAIIKIHNKGILHQKLVQAHYQQFKDPETILAEESTKKPCTRFAKGECQFGSICRYSHYTSEQINAFKEFVLRKNMSKTFTTPSFEDLYRKLQNEKSTKPQNTDGDTVLVDSNGITHVFPWTYNSILDSFGDNVPLSIKRLRLADFSSTNITQWG